MQSVPSFDAEASFDVARIVIMTEVDRHDAKFFFRWLENRLSTRELIVSVVPEGRLTQPSGLPRG
jgi:hypothetical protein